MPAAPISAIRESGKATKTTPGYNLGFVDLFLTEDCNCRCKYCFVEGKRPRAIRPEVARRTVDFLLEHSGDQRDLGILLFGGEPLLQFPLIQQVVTYAREATENGPKTIAFNMTTNGTLMTEPMMAFFSEHNIRYLLSIDGGKKTQDLHRPLADGGSSFDLLAEKLPLMKHYQPWQGARVTPLPESVHRLRQDVEALFDLGINQFIIGTATGVTWPEKKCTVFIEQMRELCAFYIQQVKTKAPIRLTLFEKGDIDGTWEDHTCTWGCGAGKGRIGVSTQGIIFGCGRFVGLNNLQGVLPLGDVFLGFTQRENREQLLDTSAWNRPACLHCVFRNSCNGGCPAVNVRVTGSVFEPSFEECQSTRVYAEIRTFAREYLRKHLSDG